MNWDRRAFVKFAVGAVVGLHASPLMPKLMDDVAIWTQNWSWVPDPTEGAVALANTVNPATGTGITAKMINSRTTGPRVIRAEGNPEHPLSRGGIVPVDAASPQASYYGGLRAEAPVMRKGGARGRVSAEEAVASVAQRLGGLANQGKAPAIGIVADDPYSITGEMLMRLAAALGTPNLVFVPTADQALAMAGTIMFGQPEIGFDLDNADYVVSFGTPLLQGFGAPAATRKAFTAWRDAKAAFVQVEPRSSITASQADLWLAAKPGTEGAVALGLAGLVMGAGKADGAAGAEDFKALVSRDFTPEKVSQLSGVPAARLREVAEGLAQAKRPLAVCGPGQAMEPGSMFDYLAVLSLNVALGNLGAEGGLVVRQPLPIKPLGEPLAMPPAARLDGGDQRLMGAFNLHHFATAAMAQKPYGLDALVVVNTNPVYQGPQAGLMRKLAEKVPYLVSISQWMDETAELADVVLPAASFWEGWGDCTTPYGSPVASYGLHRPLLSIMPESRSAADWVLALAQKLGGPAAQALPYESAEEALAQRTSEMGELEELAERSWWVQEKPAYGSFEVNTPSGRVDLAAPHLARAGELFGPPATSRERPLVLAAIPNLRTGDGRVPPAPYQMKAIGHRTLAHKDKLVVEINPATAHELHLAEGDLVEIASGAGKLTALVHLFAGAAPGMVFAPVNLGRHAFGRFIKDKGANFFEVAEVTQDPMSGLPNWGLTPVSLKKAGGVSHV
jgi:anaerobic selenocysteine-containing dehydrogenase